jgi:hypothetical protein
MRRPTSVGCWRRWSARTGWTLAEAGGFRSPNGLQGFLQSPAWDPDLVRDDVRDYVVERLGEPDGS